MSTSKELRERLRVLPPSEWVLRQTAVYSWVIALLDALDVEDAERQAHAERIVGMARLVQLPPLAPLSYPPDDEGEGHGP